MQHPHGGSDGGISDVGAHHRPVNPDFDHDGPNNHLALIYESPEEQFATAIPFVRAGLERGERCLYVVDDNSTAEVVDAMQAAGIDVAAAREAGLLSLHPTDDVSLEDGQFDPTDTITSLDETVTEAIEEQGFEHVRIAGEMTWVLDGERGTDRDALAEYEANIDHYYPSEAVTGLCQYNRDRFSPAVLRDVVRTHPQIVYEETVCQNFFYVPPAQFFDEGSPSAGFDRQLEKMLQRTELREVLREREADVAALTEAAHFPDADPAQLTDKVLENARQVLDTRHVAICLFEEGADELEPCTVLDDDFDPDRFADDLWQAFVTNETRILEGDSDVTAGAGESLVVVPLGRHGVFVAADDAGSLDTSDVGFAETVGANVRTVLDRADREAMLEDREATVRDQRERLDTIQTATELHRTVVTSLVDASSLSEVDQAVCDHLTCVDSWQFAWVGETNATSATVSVRATAGDAARYLDDVTVPATDDTTTEPAGRAAATGSLQVVDDIGTVSHDANWRQQARERGFESIAAVPVVYGGVCYGVVSVYGDEPAAFGDRAQAMLVDVGRAVAFACNALDRRRALVSDRATELDLRLPDGDPFVEFVTRTGGTVTVDGVVPEPESASEEDDRLRVFFTVGGATSEQIDAAAAAAAPFSSMSLVSDRGEELAYEGVVDRSGLLGTLLDHAVVPKSAAPDDEDGRVVVRLPTATDVASFVQMLQERYAGAELVARREVECDQATREDFRSDLRDRLTDRQWDALQMAYLSGYFEWPRERSGEEVGARLDVSQPTFNRHLRDSLRKLLTPVFDDEGGCDR